MSKCDIEIRFDRQDRMYRGGETVKGEVHIRVNEDVNCSGIYLTRIWRTHGKGNKASGEKHEECLSGKSLLSGGEDLAFPFSFVAPLEPLTYHGDIINVDHYLGVYVDVPWAFDPKAEEEFIVTPGEIPEHIRGIMDQPAEFHGNTAPKKRSLLILGVVSGIFLFIFFASKAHFFFIAALLGLGGIVWAAKPFWKWLSELRVGKVHVKAHRATVAPGESWPLELEFQPRKRFRINGIKVTLLGREIAVSGSGTNQTTHKSTICKEVHVIHPPGVISGGDFIQKKVMVRLPEKRAFSFNATDNKVVWSAEVRIDIPLFPDWTEQLSIQMVPEEYLRDGGDARGFRSEGFKPLEAVPDEHFTGEWLKESTVVDETEEAQAVEAVSWNATAAEAVPSPRSGYPNLTTLLDQLAQQSSAYEQRELAQAAKGRAYEVELEIDRIVSTFGSQAGAEYSNGKTITGVVRGTDHEIQIFTRDRNNQQLEQFSDGDEWRAFVAVQDWDTLYHRLVLLEVDAKPA